MIHGREAPKKSESNEQPALTKRSAPTPKELEFKTEPAALASVTAIGLRPVHTKLGHLQSLMLHMQRCVGNQQVTRILAGDRQEAQRLPAGPGLPTLPGRQPPLATTPAAGLAPLPERIRQEHQTLVAAGDLNGALMVVARHMEGQGEIDTSLIAPPTAAGGAAICSETALYIVGPASMGSTAAVTPCGLAERGNERVPNVRIQIGPDAIRRIETLHSTLFHEFRHVRQRHERINQSGTGTRFTPRPTDCNSPEEMDAYLSEIEAGYDRHAVMHAWVRVYVNWIWLAPEQQQVFMPRQTAARRKVDRLFPNVPWQNNALVASYQQHCQDIDRAAGGNTQGSCDSLMAPLSAPGPRWGAPIPEPSEQPPVGDFPEPPERHGVV